MFWNEDKKSNEYQISDDIVDMSFAIKCKCLPLEHMVELSETLFDELPWLKSENLAGIHPIYGAESGNGWERPNDPNELLYFSRRQKMTLRLPKERINEAEKLTGRNLKVAGYEIEIGKHTIKKLSNLPTTFCRSVMTATGMNEEVFLEWAFEELKLINIPVRKMMAGMERIVKLPNNESRITRSLMVAELKKDESIQLQQLGLGEGRKLGCGLFMPQKDIKAVNSDD